MSKVRFTPIPPEAFNDDNLSAVDFRVLGVVAGYDRLSKNGRGCFAAYGTIATDAKCDISSVKRALKRLRQRGYIKSEKGEADGRSRVLRVIYPKISGKSDTDQLSERAHIDTQIGGRLLEKIIDNHEVIGGKHTSKHIVLNEEEYAAEAASFLRNDAPAVMENDPERRFDGSSAEALEIPPATSAGALHADDVIGIKLLTTWEDAPFIARLDREIQNGRRFRSDIADKLHERVEMIFNEYDAHAGGSIGGRAYRLLETDFYRETA